MAKSATIPAHFDYKGEDMNEGVDLAQSTILHYSGTIIILFSFLRLFHKS